jgi:DNA ligase (NAD+)
VTVKLATLHNEEDIVRKDLRPGEDVIVLRAGDVIPQVLSPAPHVVDAKKRPPVPRPPKRCPFCNTETIKVEGEVFTKCPNLAVPERRWQLLKHYVSRGAMDIDGLGEKQVAQLQQAGPDQDAADYYRLRAEPADRARGLGADQRRPRRRQHRARPRIGARAGALRVGLEEVGLQSRRNLALHFRTIDALLQATHEQIEATAGSAQDGDQDPRAARRRADARADRGPAREGVAMELEGPPPGEGRWRARPSCSPARCPTSRASRPASASSAAGGRVTRACRRRPTTSWPARTRARS